ncbi:hypothetical protein P3W55_13235 [Pseudomonas citronellolis]|uniref:Uncharacterized protein n=1 Tax=Pseudomonas citronellolis TaxID=53408 RepID=A0AAW6P8G9_9PSED|nr:hypothetical protein [Pseudomonas citronellolis]MDF3842673.1 hypothetical protein [Pseudomonas citronellolis]
MVLRATGRLSGAVTAEKGDDLSKLNRKVREALQARGLARDDEKPAPPAVERAAEG